MSWVSVGHNLEAVGSKGWYLIRRAPGFSGCVLQATGHDSLPMLAVDPYGKSFRSTQLAKDYADRLDAVRVTEPSCGGE